MPGYKIDDLKRLYQSLPNLVFVGVMAFISLAFTPAFLFLLLGGELALMLISGTAPVQRILRERAERERRQEQERIQGQILSGRPDNYRADFTGLDQLCREIQGHAGEVERDNDALMRGVVDKQSGFRPA